jgi:2,5-dichloro-2,5-cyclohexadiene-1,4-diol dehydrogenase 2
MNDSLRGKIALVTGASSGIGRAHAQLFAASGAEVVVTDRQDEPGRAVAEGIVMNGGKAIFVHLDVSDESNWTAAIDLTLRSFGGLTTLINNAGIYHAAGLEEETRESWERLISVDQTGVFLGMKTTMSALRASGNSSIVNISSVLGLMGNTRCFAYHAAKAAVRMMSKTAALEFGQYNVRVNSIYPGSIPTAAHQGVREEDQAAVNAAIPLRRSGVPEDVARASRFLCSDEANYITGAELSVDGGLYPG